MSLLHERESALVAGLQAILPGHLVVAEAGELPSILRHRTFAGPAAIVRITAWDGALNAIDWSVVLIEDTASPPESRRVGSGGGGLLDACLVLRGYVLDADGLDPIGGGIARTDAAILAWEERLREFLPAVPGGSPARRPALAASLSEGVAVASGASAEDTRLDELDEFPPGSRVLASHPDFGVSDLGVTIEAEPETHELALPLEHAIPAGAVIAAAGGLLVLPVGTRVAEREEFGDWRPATARLDGRFAAGIVAPRSRRREFAFHAPTREFLVALASLLDLLESQAQVLHLDGAGGVFTAVPTASTSPPTGAGSPTLAVCAIRTTSLDPLLEGL